VVRCFVGARVAKASAARLRSDFLNRYPEFAGTPSAAVEARGHARLVPLANLHVTIRFFGSVPEGQLAGLVALVDALEATPLTVEALVYTGLPQPRRAHAIVADVAPHEALADWKARLEQQVGAEDRPFRPHVTVARLRSRIAVAERTLERPLPIDLEAPCLFRSDPVPGGVRYTPVTVLPDP
jgi:RNA 2',3'-cyclic 3'-phosphodiesterase